MGIGASNPVDEATKNEIQELIKSICKTFTVEYTKWYAIYLVEFLKNQAMEKHEDFKLLTRPEDTSDIKTGYLMKEGGMRKTWKKRYFVVKYDYKVDYYEKEDDLKKAKPKAKGTMSLAGYWVNTDVNGGLLNRAKKMAEKMGVDFSELPKPKEYPPHTMEIYHWRRRSYYVQCENEEDFKQWTNTFQNCCRWAYGYNNKDPVHKQAFEEAIRRTRWELGRWGWYTWGGSEEQILSDLISDQIDWAIMGRIYSKLSGSWTIRNAVRNQVIKTIDSFVSAAVGPAWKAMDEAVKQVRPKIEPVVKEIADPLGKAQRQIIDKISEACLSIINPILQEHVTPHLGKIVEVIKSPMTEAFDESFKIYDEHFGKFSASNKDEALKGFKDLDYLPRSWHMYKATDKTDCMYEPLWLLHVIFEDIYPWSYIYQAHDTIRTTMDNAAYTFEQRLLKAIEEGADPNSVKDKLKAEVLEDYKTDANKLAVLYYADILKKIVMPPFNKLVVPACKEALEPLQDLIPDVLKNPVPLVNVYKLFDEVLDQVISGAINTVLSSA